MLARNTVIVGKKGRTKNREHPTQRGATSDWREGDCMKILLVEDSRTIRRENERVLRKAGYDVVSAEDGESALVLAREQNPDLILLDMILPRMSGPETLKG